MLTAPTMDNLCRTPPACHVAPVFAVLVITQPTRGGITVRPSTKRDAMSDNVKPPTARKEPSTRLATRSSNSRDGL